MKAFPRLLLIASFLQIASSAGADEWPADPAEATSKVGYSIESTASKQESLEPVITKKAPKKRTGNKASPKPSVSAHNTKHSSFGNAMSAQANKMATTENPYNKNSSASVIAERRGNLATQHSHSHPHK